MSEANKKWRKANPNYDRDFARKTAKERPAYYLLKQARSRSKTYKIPFELKEEYIAKLLEPMYCAVTGVALSWSFEHSYKAWPWRPSLDQIEAGKGYIKGNVQVVCWAYNVAKQDWPEGVVQKMAEGLCQFGPQ